MLTKDPKKDEFLTSSKYERDESLIMSVEHNETKTELLNAHSVDTISITIIIIDLSRS